MLVFVAAYSCLAEFSILTMEAACSSSSCNALHNATQHPTRQQSPDIGKAIKNVTDNISISLVSIVLLESLESVLFLVFLVSLVAVVSLVSIVSVAALVTVISLVSIVSTASVVPIESLASV
jgi:hypothetical protein